MLAELLMILWLGTDPNTGATLEVSCDKVEIDYGGKPTSNKIKITFGKYDPQFNYLWKYSIPMKVSPTGALLLEPTEDWIEEIRTQDELIVEIEGKIYTFNLTGTAEKIKC